MAMISILVCSRISGNKNWSLFNLLESLKQKSSSYDNFEVLIKFDSDDKKVGKILPKLDTYPFKIKYLVEPRGRGYLDLHIFYNRLFSLVDKRSVVIAAMADDFEIIQKDWDEIILSKVNIFPDQIFIIRTGSTVLHSRKNEQEQRFHLNFDINALEYLYIVDEAPFWARKLLDVCGGVGHIGSSTDVWTITLEYYLFHRCGIIALYSWNNSSYTEKQGMKLINPSVLGGGLIEQLCSLSLEVPFSKSWSNSKR